MARKTILLLLTFAVFVHAAKFPSDWIKCPKTDNEECLKEGIEKAVKALQTGRRELNAIPMDPLRFQRMEMLQGGDSPVNVNLTFYDVDMTGTSRIKVTSAKADWDNYYLEFEFDVLNGPAILLGDYTVDGKVLVLPIQGKGSANITIDNLHVLLTFKGSELLKNNKKYFNVDSSDFIIRCDKAHIFLGNLFDGVPNLGENMNKFLNDNWREIFSEINGTISGAMGLAIKQVTNNIFHKIPVTQLYS